MAEEDRDEATHGEEAQMSSSEEHGERAIEDDNVIHVNFGQASSRAGEPEERAPGEGGLEELPADPLARKKHDIFSKFIEEGMVSVTLDPRGEGVCVPPQFDQRPELVLNFSHRFFIDDFTYDERAVCASLSFSGQPFYCVVPWSAVKLLHSSHDNSVAVFDADMLY